MIDCHNHFQDQKLGEYCEQIVGELKRLGVNRWLVNGTGEEDWAEVANLADQHEEVVPQFGIHPWKSANRSSEWLASLGGYLERYPNAGVGEVGLDKWMKNPDIADQSLAFREQLDLAVELDRPVTIHCLQAWGTLRDVLKRYRGKIRFLLHSFGGPVEMVNQFVELGAYFSLSGYIFRPDKANKLAAFQMVPKERILLETDAPDMALPRELVRFRLGSGEVNHPGNIAVVYDEAAQLFGLAKEEMAQLIEQNFSAWYGELG